MHSRILCHKKNGYQFIITKKKNRSLRGSITTSGPPHPTPDTAHSSGCGASPGSRKNTGQGGWCVAWSGTPSPMGAPTVAAVVAGGCGPCRETTAQTEQGWHHPSPLDLEGGAHMLGHEGCGTSCQKFGGQAGKNGLVLQITPPSQIHFLGGSHGI